jgi:hypothetical protein
VEVSLEASEERKFREALHPLKEVTKKDRLIISKRNFRLITRNLVNELELRKFKFMIP